MNHWRGQRVYNARNGRYEGTFQGYHGSAYAVIKKNPRTPAVRIRMDKIQ